MRGIKKFWGMVVVLVFAGVACSSGGSTGTSAPLGETTAPVETDAGDAATSADFPDFAPPGQARLEVDGLVLEGPVETCQVSESGFVAGAKTTLDGREVDFGVTLQGGPNYGGTVLASIGLQDTVRYGGGTNIVGQEPGRARVEGSMMVLVSPFTRTEGDTTENVGIGTFAASCA